MSSSPEDILKVDNPSTPPVPKRRLADDLPIRGSFTPFGTKRQLEDDLQEQDLFSLSETKKQPAGVSKREKKPLFLESSNEIKQRRYLIVLLARLRLNDYWNDNNHSNDIDIVRLKEQAQQFVDKKGACFQEDEDVIAFCQKIKDNCEKAKKHSMFWRQISAASRNLYSAGANSVEALITYLETQEKEAQIKNRQERMPQEEIDAKEEEQVNESEPILPQDKDILLDLLINLNVEDYPEHSPIRMLREEALAVRTAIHYDVAFHFLLQDIRNIKPILSVGRLHEKEVNHNNLSALLAGLLAVLLKDKAIEDCPMLLKQIALCNNRSQRGRLHCLLLNSKAVDRNKLNHLLTIYGSENNTAELAQAWLALPGPLEKKNWNLTQQYANALLERPGMEQLKELVTKLRNITPTACGSAGIPRETADKVLHCLNVEVIESVHNMGRPADRVKQGPACHWNFLRIDSEKISPEKEVIWPILMGVGIVVGLGFLVGLGLATGGVAPAVFAAVAATIATVAPPITLPLAIMALVTIAEGLGVCIHQSRRADISSEKAKISGLAHNWKNPFSFQSENRRVSGERKERGEREVDSSPMKIDRNLRF